MICQIVEKYLCKRSCHTASTISHWLYQLFSSCYHVEEQILRQSLHGTFLSEISSLLLFSVRTWANTVVMESLRKFPLEEFTTCCCRKSKRVECSIFRAKNVVQSQWNYTKVMWHNGEEIDENVRRSAWLTWAGPCTALRMSRTGNGCSGLRFADVRLFCSFLMTFGKNNESIFVETTWLVYREEYLSKFKWNCYLTSKKFALTEMAMEPFWHYGPNHHYTYVDCQRRACLLA